MPNSIVSSDILRPSFVPTGLCGKHSVYIIMTVLSSYRQVTGECGNNKTTMVLSIEGFAEHGGSHTFICQLTKRTSFSIYDVS